MRGNRAPDALQVTAWNTFSTRTLTDSVRLLPERLTITRKGHKATVRPVVAIEIPTWLHLGCAATSTRRHATNHLI
jgi:hypothetical protein